MKATGIIRRIDDLGRIVIPKEIRRILRLREGDPMEIFIQDNGVCFQKYSPIGELAEFAQEYADSLYDVTGHTVLIGDRDNIIAVAGTPKKNLLMKPIWSLAEKSMEEHKTLMESGNTIIEEFSYKSQVVTPITCEGDVIGVVGLISKNGEVGLMEQKLVETAARFLSKQMKL